MRPRAFTLIELLVVIAIIAVLAGIALPVFTRVMERGKATSDANNLRQLGIAILVYQGDNSDAFPASATWPTDINPKYVSVWKSFQSPFDKRTASESGGASSPVSYDMNLNIAGKNSSTVISSSNCVMAAPLLDPSSTANNLVFNSSASTPGLPAKLDKGVDLVGTHNSAKQINVLFADSHISAMLITDFNTAVTSVPATVPPDIRWNK
jgi:prepilin-type N-terminal cleavage/methylation domain-containing protein